MAESQTLATKLLESEKIAKSRMERVAGLSLPLIIFLTFIFFYPFLFFHSKGDSTKLQNELQELKEKLHILTGEHNQSLRDVCCLRDDKTALEERLEVDLLLLFMVLLTLIRIQEVKSHNFKRQ
jgi:hypothetical protein